MSKITSILTPAMDKKTKQIVKTPKEGNMKRGDKVKCLTGNIDKNIGAGEIGFITGFARFSSYHAREVFISDKPEGNSTAPWCGWFWLTAIEKV